MNSISDMTSTPSLDLPSLWNTFDTSIQQSLTQEWNEYVLTPGMTSSSTLYDSTAESKEMEGEIHCSNQFADSFIHSKMPLHRRLTLLAEGISPVRIFTDRASDITTQYDRDKTDAIAQWLQSFLRELPLLQLPILDHGIAGIRCGIISKHDVVSASRPHPCIHIFAIVPMYPSRGDIKKIPHTIPYNGNAMIRPRPRFSSSCINEALLSPKALKRRLQEAKATTFSGTSGAEACSSDPVQRTNAILTHIIWPLKLITTHDQNGGEGIPMSYVESAKRITDLSALQQERVYNISHNIAVAIYDENTMRTYYNTHFESLYRTRLVIGYNKKKISRLRREMERTSRTAMAIRSAQEKGHLGVERELERWFIQGDDVKAEAAFHSFQKKACSKWHRVDERYFVRLLDQWDKSWIAMGGRPAEDIRRLREGTKMPLRWAAGRRGWIGLSAEDFVEEKQIVEEEDTVVAEDDVAEQFMGEEEDTEVEDDMEWDGSNEEDVTEAEDDIVEENDVAEEKNVEEGDVEEEDVKEEDVKDDDV